MGIVSHHEHAVAEHGYTPVGALGGIAGNVACAFAAVVPDGSAGTGVEREDLVRSGDGPAAFDRHRRHLEHEMVDREEPLEREALHIGDVDEVKSAVTVAPDVAVITG